MSADSMIKVWDLRTQGCLQTITPQSWPQAEDSCPTALTFDGVRRRLVTIKHRPAAWPQRCISDLSCAHAAPLVGGLVNSAFQVVR